MRYRKQALFLMSAVLIVACAGYGTIGGDDGPGDDPGDDNGGGDSCENDSQCPDDRICEDHLCRTPAKTLDGGPSDTDAGTPDGGPTDPPDGGHGDPSDGGGGNPTDGGSSGTDAGTPDGGPTDPPDGGHSDPSDGGGGNPTDGGTPGCVKDKDCPAGKVCEDRICVPECPGRGDGGSDDTCGDGPRACQAGKTLICHVPPGNPSNRHSICVGNPAVPAHLGHGDSAGCCPK
jgi:hypothetical protein